MAIEIVDLPVKNGDFPTFFVCLPGRVSHRRWFHRPQRSALEASGE